MRAGMPRLIVDAIACPGATRGLRRADARSAGFPRGSRRGAGTLITGAQVAPSATDAAANADAGPVVNCVLGITARLSALRLAPPPSHSEGRALGTSRGCPRAVPPASLLVLAPSRFGRHWYIDRPRLPFPGALSRVFTSVHRLLVVRFPGHENGKVACREIHVRVTRGPRHRGQVRQAIWRVLPAPPPLPPPRKTCRSIGVLGSLARALKRVGGQTRGEPDRGRPRRSLLAHAVDPSVSP